MSTEAGGQSLHGNAQQHIQQHFDNLKGEIACDLRFAEEQTRCLYPAVKTVALVSVCVLVGSFFWLLGHAYACASDMDKDIEVKNNRVEVIKQAVTIASVLLTVSTLFLAVSEAIWRAAFAKAELTTNLASDALRSVERQIDRQIESVREENQQLREKQRRWEEANAVRAEKIANDMIFDLRSFRVVTKLLQLRPRGHVQTQSEADSTHVGEHALTYGKLGEVISGIKVKQQFTAPWKIDTRRYFEQVTTRFLAVIAMHEKGYFKDGTSLNKDECQSFHMLAFRLLVFTNNLHWHIQNGVLKDCLDKVLDGLGISDPTNNAEIIKGFCARVKSCCQPSNTTLTISV